MFFRFLLYAPRTLGCCALFVSTSTTVLAEQVYQEPAAFLQEAFEGTVPPASVLYLTGERRSAAAQIMGYSPTSIRCRYWKNDRRSVWILEEIGKVLPITAGFIVEDSKIKDVRILIYRESHGMEVRHEYFTEQFEGAELTAERRLTKTIDGISGATLSVNAIRKLAALALFYDSEVRK